RRRGRDDGAQASLPGRAQRNRHVQRDARVTGGSGAGATRGRMKWGLLCFVPLLACASGAPARGPAPEKLHETCLYACNNVKRVRPCTARQLSASAHSPSEIVAAASELHGRFVRVRGKLGTGEGVWTQIDCPRDTCC